MAWKFSAIKGAVKINGSGPREDTIRETAGRYRKLGYKVRVYQNPHPGPGGVSKRLRNLQRDRSIHRG